MEIGLENKSNEFIQNDSILNSLVEKQLKSEGLAKHHLNTIRLLNYLNDLEVEGEKVGQSSKWVYLNSLKVENLKNYDIICYLIQKFGRCLEQLRKELIISNNWLPSHSEDDAMRTNVFSLNDKYIMICSKYFFVDGLWHVYFLKQLQRTNPIYLEEIISQYTFLRGNAKYLTGRDRIVHYININEFYYCQEQEVDFSISSRFFSDWDKLIRLNIGKLYDVKSKNQLTLKTNVKHARLKLLLYLVFKTTNEKRKLNLSDSFNADDNLVLFLDSLLFIGFSNSNKSILPPKIVKLDADVLTIELSRKLVNLFIVLSVDFDCLKYSRKLKPNSKGMNIEAIARFLNYYFNSPDLTERAYRTILEEQKEKVVIISSSSDGYDCSEIYNELGISKFEIRHILADRDSEIEKKMKNLFGLSPSVTKRLTKLMQ